MCLDYTGALVMRPLDGCSGEKPLDTCIQIKDFKEERN